MHVNLATLQGVVQKLVEHVAILLWGFLFHPALVEFEVFESRHTQV
jgi:hypothetical protein